MRIGISGWRYKGWRGVFYPEDLPQKSELEFASHALPTIEIDGSFYSLQRPESYAPWYGATPNDFVFSVEAPRFMTHIRRLRDVEKPLANFFASGSPPMRSTCRPIRRGPCERATSSATSTTTSRFARRSMQSV